jgi:D-tyrosyl-tRNA(Tyr) deacylase
VRAVVQRVSQASVTVDGRVVGAIDQPGLLVLVGVTHGDTPELAAKMAAKVWHLRILDGEKSCADVAAPLLVISQFTLYADTRKGRRPSWLAAAPGRSRSRSWTRWSRRCGIWAPAWRPASSAPT